MLSIQNVHKAFGAQVVFDGASLQMNQGDRYALMGPNGAGKSTLFRMITGEDTPDDGFIQFPRGLKMAYLPQETAEFTDGNVIHEALSGAFPAGGGLDPTDRDVAEAKKILMGLGFRVTDFDRPVGNLSGGWRMRVAIARLLLQKPDLMLLDEPTNHLDLQSLLWFQEYLKASKSSILLISHDRAFVNALVGGILDLRRQKINRYVGNYEKFLGLRQLEEEQLRAAYDRQQKEISDAWDFINRFRAQASKAPQVQSRLKWLDKLEKVEIPPEAKMVRIKFPQPPKSGVRALSLTGVSKSYGPVQVYKDLDFELERGRKMVLVGPNGAGKSTLLKILAGVLPIDGGTRELGLNVSCGYFSQHRLDTLRADKSVIEEAMDTKRMNPDLMVRTVLGTFLFPGDSVYKKVAVLSGGEKSRVALAKILLDPPNLMLLDEPTTHLDMASVDALVEALKEYEGTLIFISHDVYFVNALADHVVHVIDGKVTVYPGNYGYFERRQAQLQAEGGDEAPDVSVEKRADVSRPGHVKSSSDDVKNFREAEKARKKARQKMNARLREIEDELDGLRAEQGSVFIQSDYKKLMVLDQSVKELEDEKAKIAAELASS